MGVSPREMWNGIDSKRIVARPTAAHTVSCGLMRSKEGSNKPMPPRSSAIAMNLTIAEGTLPVQGIIAESFSMGMVAFMNPDIRNMAINNTCTTHKEISIVFEEFLFSIFLSFKLFKNLFELMMQKCNDPNAENDEV